MSGLVEKIKAMFGFRPESPVEDDRVLLDNGERRVAGRLSRMTGKTRDEVLAESYRRADEIRRREVLRVEAESMRRGR